MFAAKQRRMVPDHQSVLYVAREPFRTQQVPCEATLDAIREAAALTQVQVGVLEAATR
jgi:hypothetical protein